MKLESADLSLQEIEEIERLISKPLNSSFNLEHLWQMMDRVWDEIGLDAQNLDSEKIKQFYSHPVWILNGLFVEQDELSIQHRLAIANWIGENIDNNKSILDYGGGFGTLARLVAEKNQNLIIDICEPFPSKVAVEKARAYPNIHFISSIIEKYDCLLSIDVLEHVPDPLNLLALMSEQVKLDGYLIIANCFYPVIKCHLHTTFHLRYTFDLFARLMGIKLIEKCNYQHIKIYKKVKNKRLKLLDIKTLEKLSKTIFPLLNLVNLIYINFKNLLK